MILPRQTSRFPGRFRVRKRVLSDHLLLWWYKSLPSCHRSHQRIVARGHCHSGRVTGR